QPYPAHTPYIFGTPSVTLLEKVTSLLDKLSANPNQNCHRRKRRTRKRWGCISHASPHDNATDGSTSRISQVQCRVVQRRCQSLCITGNIHETNLQAWGQGCAKESDKSKVNGAQDWIVGGKEEGHENQRDCNQGEQNALFQAAVGQPATEVVTGNIADTVDHQH